MSKLPRVKPPDYGLKRTSPISKAGFSSPS